MADKTFTLEIVTPDRVVSTDEDVVSLVVPGVDGYLGVMAHHAPLLTELTVGEITVRHSGNVEEHIATAGGFLEVSDNKATILSDAAEKAEEIDMTRAEESVKRAEERLAHSTAETDLARARASLMRAMNRLRVASHR
jgi:F-type H+-transporting ATPase subunit epsilon